MLRLRLASGLPLELLDAAGRVAADRAAADGLLEFVPVVDVPVAEVDRGGALGLLPRLGRAADSALGDAAGGRSAPAGRRADRPERAVLTRRAGCSPTGWCTRCLAGGPGST